MVFKLWQQNPSLSDALSCGMRGLARPQQVTQVEQGQGPGSYLLTPPSHPTSNTCSPGAAPPHSPASVRRRLLLGLSNLLLANKLYIPVI